MANQQGKGVFVGAKLKAGFPKIGTTQKGEQWQLFTYKESKKNPQTGDYDELGKYTIWVTNPNQYIKHNDTVTVKNITKILYEKNFANGKEFLNISVWCEVELTVYTPSLPQQPQFNQAQYNNDIIPPSFDEIGIDDDSLPF